MSPYHPPVDIEVPEGYELKWLEATSDEDLFMALREAIFPCLLVALSTALFLGLLLQQRRADLGGLLGSSEVTEVALVVAHPDDEAMFFWPTLLQLRARAVKVSVLSLSNGNYDGLGKTREKEMKDCLLRLDVEDLVILDEEGLQDGWRSWDEELVAKRVHDWLEVRNAQLVVTFDDLGVSGHPNHVSASRGVRKAALLYENFPKVLMLDSEPLLRKYIGVFSLWGGSSSSSSSPSTSALSSTCDATFAGDSGSKGNIERTTNTKSNNSSNNNNNNKKNTNSKSSPTLKTLPEAAEASLRQPFACLRALSSHWSQLLWYRVLFTLFSRYSYVNTFTEFVVLPDAAPGLSEATKKEESTNPDLRKRVVA